MNASVQRPAAVRGTSRPRVRPGLITHRAAARVCHVSPKVVLQWVNTGAWPLPRSVFGTSFCFDRSDVRLWVDSGCWPPDARFRDNGVPGATLGTFAQLTRGRSPR
jgi:hypothetical protein